MINKDTIVARAEKYFDAWVPSLRSAVDEILGTNASFADREVVQLTLANEIVRRQLQADVQRLEDAFGERIWIDGDLCARHEIGAGEYASLCGPLMVTRHTFRLLGKHNGPTVVAVERAAGIIEGATPAMARCTALGYAERNMRAHAKQLEASHRVPPPRATLERMAKNVGAAACEQIVEIEPALRKAESIVDGAHAVSIGLDRTSVPMEEPLPAEEAHGSDRTRPRVRKAPDPVQVAWRMAYVGTVTVHGRDRDGEPLTVRRYAGLPNDGPEEIVERMMKDVQSLRRQQSLLFVQLMQDGAPEMWNATRRGLENIGVNLWYEGIDHCHLMERLGKYTALTIPGTQERKATIERWRELLDTDDAAIDVIERQMRRQYSDAKTSAKAELFEHLVYIRNNKDRMRYATFRRLRLPVGSGITEGAAKSVGVRAKGRGQRWHERGLAAVLALRFIEASDRFGGFWRQFSRSYTSNITLAA